VEEVVARHCEVETAVLGSSVCNHIKNLPLREFRVKVREFRGRAGLELFLRLNRSRARQ